VNGSGKINRRGFLRKTVGATAAALGAGACARTTRSSYRRIIGANDRINIGVIGCGGMGLHHVNHYTQMSRDPKYNIAVVAVCDIYKPRLEVAAKRSGGKPFHDYRRMLEMPGLDAVIIATPDHWHARMAIDAMEAGKDVHVEKPMTRYWEEAREVYRTALRTKSVVQVGAEGCSCDLFWQARRLVKEGALGKVVWCTGGVYRNIPQGDWNYPIDPRCTPETLDWKAFLGPAPWHPFDPERFFRYRKYWDYSGGLAHDLLSHVLSAMMVVLGGSFPKRVMGAGGIYIHHDREVPDTFHMMIEYPGDYTITLFSTQDNEHGVDFVIRGQRATLCVPKDVFAPDAVLTIEPERPFAKGSEVRRVGKQPRPDHDENWIQCIRSREKPACDVLLGYQVMVALDLANKSYLEGKMMHFDAEKERAFA